MEFLQTVDDIVKRCFSDFSASKSEIWESLVAQRHPRNVKNNFKINKIEFHPGIGPSILNISIFKIP